MLKLLDSLLNKVTMYWLTLNVLRALIGAAVVLSFFHLLPYSPIDILLDALIAVIVCWGLNIILAKLFHAETNVESARITALILTLIIPVKFPVHLPFLLAACVAAMLVKYIPTIEKRHIFNPAAAAVLGISLLSPEHTATWWVGTVSMAPFVFIGGLLIMRKIQRESMLATFFTAYFLLLAASAIWHQGSLQAVFSIWQKGILDSSLLFFAFIMFTEPVTSPSTTKLRNWYTYVVAVLFVTPQLRLFSVALTPEMALIAGNVFSYFISPNYRFVLPFKKKEMVTNIGIFSFPMPPKFKFIAGQYMEWTLPHTHADSRGNRRYFSIGSSPTEKELLLGIRKYEPSSSFKKILFSLGPGDEIIATQLKGDFVLPQDIKKPLVFIGSGVGIVPFRSMVKYIVDKNLQVDIILFYVNKTKEEIVFADVFRDAEKNGVKTIYIIPGPITKEMIEKEVPEFSKRTFYLAGAQPVVEKYHDMLRNIGVSRDHIIQDFFPGYEDK